MLNIPKDWPRDKVGQLESWPTDWPRLGFLLWVFYLFWVLFSRVTYSFTAELYALCSFSLSWFTLGFFRAQHPVDVYVLETIFALPPSTFLYSILPENSSSNGRKFILIAVWRPQQKLHQGSYGLYTIFKGVSVTTLLFIYWLISFHYIFCLFNSFRLQSLNSFSMQNSLSRLHLFWPKLNVIRVFPQQISNTQKYGICCSLSLKYIRPHEWYSVIQSAFVTLYILSCGAFFALISYCSLI